MKISFCITALNWLEYLAKTLPVTLGRVAYYDTEYVLLDLGSTDGTQEYVLNHFEPLINIGALVYCRAESYRHYEPSFAKNAATKLSTGDVVCNLDGDNFCAIEFVAYLRSLFQSRPELGAVFYPGLTDRTGRIAVKRDVFFNLGGYDETLRGYGSEDIDFRERVTRSLAPVCFGDPQKYSAILNPDKSAANYICKDVIGTDTSNRSKAMINSRAGRLIANQGKAWGKIIVKRNFKDYIETE